MTDALTAGVTAAGHCAAEDNSDTGLVECLGGGEFGNVIGR